MTTVECVKQQHHHHQVQQQHKYHQMNNSSFKIPMWLCMRPSITQEDYQDHHLSKWDAENSSSLQIHQQDNNKKNKSKKKHNRSSSSCSIEKDAPGSPKVGCMGQVKHNHQQQLTFLSVNNQHQQHTTGNPKKYFKLNKMFSSNSFSYTRTTSRTNHMITAAATAPNNSKLIIQHHNHNTKDQQEQHAASSSESSSSSSSESSSTTTSSSFSLASVGDLDPPLPVIKRSLTTTNACNGDVSSIWKRRCGGEVALKGLQLSSTIKRPIIIPQPLASL